jgi:hypothetical protein
MQKFTILCQEAEDIQRSILAYCRKLKCKAPSCMSFEIHCKTAIEAVAIFARDFHKYLQAIGDDGYIETRVTIVAPSKRRRDFDIEVSKTHCNVA